MAVTLYDVNSETGLKKLDDYLLARSYITGYQASKDDVTVYAAFPKAPSSQYENVSRWYNHIDALLRVSGVTGEGSGVTVKGVVPITEDPVATPPAADTKAAAADDDDDDVDLFGEETEEEKKAAEERAAAVKASSKKKETGKSSVLMDVKPWDDETDMKKLEEAVRGVQMEGLLWGASKLAPVGYGIKKLQIMLTIVDDLVSVDNLIEDHLLAEPINEYVQSCDIVAFNKISMATMQFYREGETATEREEEGAMQGSPTSPEAKLGLQVEGLWAFQEPELSPTEKLNACFESIPVSAFPQDASSQVVEIKSDTTLAEAVKILAQHNILSAPVVSFEAPEDASWIDRYIGIVEFAGIVVWVLHQSEPPSPRTPSSAVAAAANGHAPLEFVGFDLASAADTSGNFFEDLTSSELYKSTKVVDISGSFRWAPFLALQRSNSFLTMLLLLSTYKMKSIPVVDLGANRLDTIITQSAVIHMLAECAGLQWFESWGTKKLSEVGLPLMTQNQIIKVYENEPVLQAFKVMRKKRVGGLPVVDMGGNKAVGNISLPDVQYLLISPEIYHDYRSITAKGFLTAVKNHLEKHKEVFPKLSDLITCKKDCTIKELIRLLDRQKTNRIYVVDDDENLEGVITLRDIISRLVHEPRGYFGDFFDGVLPQPPNCRV